MRHHLTFVIAATLAALATACATDPEGQSEAGDPNLPCEDRKQADCSGLVNVDDQYGASCTWTTLIPLTDAGNSCAMGAGEGRCMAIEPVLDGCDPATELQCVLENQVRSGTGAVVELDGQVYLLDGSFICWPPGPMTICEELDSAPGCECACELILDG